ncbi:hypothetical protein GCM10027422_21040 [Hymenobacter arcticus]
MTHKKKWLLLAPGGLLLIGAGACLVGWANTLKTQGSPPAKWIAAGTVALATLNAGVSVVGQSVIEKVLHELREQPAPIQKAP